MRALPYALLLLCAPLLWGGCERDELVGYDMSYFQDLEIQAGLNPFEVHYFEFNDLPTRQADFLQGNPIGRIQNEYAYLTALAPGEELDFLWRVSVQVRTDNGPYFEVAFREDIPLNTGQRLDLIPTLVDFKDILSAERFDLRLRFEFRQPPPQFTDVRLDMGFVAAKP